MTRFLRDFFSIDKSKLFCIGILISMLFLNKAYFIRYGLSIFDLSNDLKTGFGILMQDSGRLNFLANINLGVLVLTWFGISIAATLFLWFLEILYTDIRNFLVIKLKFTQSDDDTSLLVKKELGILKRLVVHLLVIIPCLLVITLLYYFYIIYDERIFQPAVSAQYPIFYLYAFLSLFYWYLVLSLIFYPAKAAKRYFADEGLKEEHSASGS